MSNIREILSSDEDSFFNDEGEWTEKGVAVLGTYIQEIELYKNYLGDVEKEMLAFQKEYKGSEAYYAEMGIDSEQEYYDKLTELTDKQHEYTKVINDSEQSVVDMYESQVEAIEEYTNTLVESYQDYIDNVKEALEAERDLYDFKKNVAKQTKDISSLERRIASLSGSTNASDIAERRKLESQLFESKESLNDTYYDHAQQTRQQALDDEATAYEESMTRYVENLRIKLDEATLNMETFMTNVSNTMILNAGTIRTEYENTGLKIDAALTTPWDNAMAKVSEYAGEKGLMMMNAWTAEGGTFDKFSTEASSLMAEPFEAGKSAMGEFSSTVSSGMTSVYNAIKTNVQESVSQLNQLKAKYEEVQDSDVRFNAGGGGGGDGGQSTPTPDPEIQIVQEILKNVYFKNVEPTGIWDEATSEAMKEVQKRTLNVPDNGKYDSATAYAMKKNLQKLITLSRQEANKPALKLYQNYLGKIPPAFFAKGTMGTDRDQWAITDESWIGEEITLAAGKSGRLRGMMKGSAVLPSNISENLVEWGQLSPDEMHSGNITNNYINAPTNDVDVENSLTIDGKSSSTQGVHDSIKDTYELIEDTVRDIDSVTQHYKPSVDEALTTPWVDATGKADEFNAAVNTNYDEIVSHIDENKESLEIALNTPYDNVAGRINDFSQHAQKTSVDDVITHANEQSSTLTAALSTGFNNAKNATNDFKTSGTSAVNAVKDSLTNSKTGLIKALNDTADAAQKTKQAIDGVPTSSGGSSTSVKAGQHYISSLGKNVTLSSNVTKWSGVAAQALQKTGQYSYDNLLLLLHQMQTESSGNQNAINNWDINAKNGTPSKGLMQVIDPTFRAYAMNGYDKDIYDPLSNIIAAIRYTTSRYGSLSKGWRGSGYAKGTTGTLKDEWALTDELGPELTMYATPEGTLSFMRAGSTVVPADITANLVEWGKLNPDMLNVNGTPNINMISNAVNKPEFNLNVENFLRCDNVSQDSLPELKRFVNDQMNSLMKQLNYGLKKSGAR